MDLTAPARPPRGRLAPSPTGLMHLGNARSALVAWLSVRKRSGTLVWRLEDLDTPRVVAGMDAAAEEDLAWLGLDWDEGPSRGGGYAPYEQSRRTEDYVRALVQLEEAGRVYPCPLSRRDLEQIASAPHGHPAEAYPSRLRPDRIDQAWLADLREGKRSDAAVRFRVSAGRVCFHDRILGAVEQDVEATVGDFVLRRRDGLFAYQLAVVVDDLAMGIDDVVRGADLLDSTARQLQLIEALGGSPPEYSHVPLVRNSRGEKLSKRDDCLTLRSLRAGGVAAPQIVGYLAHGLGLSATPRPCSPADLVAAFSWDALSRDELLVPDDLAAALTRI